MPGFICHIDDNRQAHAGKPKDRTTLNNWNI